MAFDQLTSILVMKLRREEQRRQEAREDQARSDAMLQKSLQDMTRKQTELHSQQMARDSMDLKLAAEQYRQMMESQRNEVETAGKVAKAQVDHQKAMDLEQSRWDRMIEQGYIKTGIADIRAGGRKAAAKDLTAAQRSQVTQNRRRLQQSDKSQLLSQVNGEIRAIETARGKLVHKSLGKAATPQAQAVIDKYDARIKTLREFKGRVNEINLRGNMGKTDTDLNEAQMIYAGTLGSGTTPGNIAPSLTPGGEVPSLAPGAQGLVLGGEEEPITFESVPGTDFTESFKAGPPGGLLSDG